MIKFFRRCKVINTKSVFFLFLSIVFSAVGMLISLYEPLILGDIIDNLSSLNIRIIYKNIILYIICSLFGILIISFCRFLISHTNLNLVSQLRILFYNKIISAKISAFQGISSGDLISKFEADISIFSNFIAGNLVSFFVNCISMILIVLYMVNINFKITIYLLILVPIDILLIKIFGRVVKKISISARKANSNYIAFFEESINGIKDIKSFEIENLFKSKMKKLQEAFTGFNLKISSVELGINAFNKIFLVAVNVLIILAFIPFLSKSLLSVGAFVAFVNYTGKLYSSIFGLADIYTKWKSVSTSLERISDVLFVEEEIMREVDNEPHFLGEISFKNVSFRYASGSWCLKNFNAQIHEKNINIFVGTSGAGKTSICELLLSFYDISEGEILVSGIKLKDLNRKTLRNRISYISQTSYFFDMNAFDYLRLGNPNLSRIDAANILELIGLAELAKDVGEQHENSPNFKIQKLSAGQKQRLSIARGLVKKADIYIFDEPTSSLDAENKEYVLNAISKLYSYATVIIITHDKVVIDFFQKKNIVYVQSTTI